MWLIKQIGVDIYDSINNLKEWNRFTIKGSLYVRSTLGIFIPRKKELRKMILLGLDSGKIAFDNYKKVLEGLDITNDTKYDDVIKISIYCQNKVGLPNGLNDKMLHFCKVLKDAHTIDNFRMVINYPYMDMHIDNFPNDLVYNTFKQYQVISNKVSDNDADNILEVLSLIFGLNYHYSYILLKQEECVDKLIASLKMKDKSIKKFFNQIGAVLNMYIDRKISG